MIPNLHNRLSNLFICMLTAGGLWGQPDLLLTLAVSAGDCDRLDSPVSFSLDGLAISQDPESLRLVERVGNEDVQVDVQTGNGRLWWILTGVTPAGAKRIFHLYGAANPTDTKQAWVVAAREPEGVRFHRNGKNILHYQYEPVAAPPGKPMLNRRGGFIHPLWSPGGEVLTAIQPADHAHHLGIWNPWTRVKYEGRQVDFWNLYEGQGTVKPLEPPTVVSGPVFGEMAVRHAHVDLTAPHPDGAKTALDENWHIRAWSAPAEKGPWVIDFSSELNVPGDSVFAIQAYRYQGFGYRATGKWDDRTAQLLTSEGKNKSDANGIRARWIDANGVSAHGRAGVLLMSHPHNYNHPEHLRIWPVGMNEGKENVFINFNPAQEQNWTLEPGKSYKMQYRMVVYNGELPAETLEKYWQDYARPAAVEVILNNTVPGKKILVYTKNGNGYVHDNRTACVEAIKKLGEQNGFQVDATEDPTFITEENLQKYQAVICANTNNETFDTEANKLAFQRYIQAGGGFVGIHSASGSERQWPWFWQLLGGKFRRHPPLQRFDIRVLDRRHPATLHLPQIWSWEDECYYLDQLNPANHVLLAADLNTIDDDQKSTYPGTVFGRWMPLSWSRETDAGRVWYTALGHKIEYYSDPEFLQHLLGGIRWVLDGTDRLDYGRATNVLINE